MPVGYTYTVPLDYTEETNDTLIAKRTIKVIDCSNNLDPNELCGLWNFNRCLNDDKYCNPYIKGDLLYFQYEYSSRLVKHIIPVLYDSVTGLPIEPVSGLGEVQQGQNPTNEKSYYNLIVNTDFLPDSVTCFYVKLNFYNCDLKDNDPYNDCVQERKDEGMSTYMAQLTCYEALCEDKTEVISEPYCLVRCTDKTILISGAYTKFDCDGQYYGDFPVNVPNIYKPQIRIYGEVVIQNIAIEEILINNARKSTQKRENYILYSKKLPYYVVKIVAKVFNSQIVYIDGYEYKGAISLNKNFDEGSMWILKEPIYRLCDEIDFTCK